MARSQQTQHSVKSHLPSTAAAVATTARGYRSSVTRRHTSQLEKVVAALHLEPLGDAFDPQQLRGTLERVFHAALTDGDVRGVEAALRVLAVRDPERAQRLYDDLKFALRMAEIVGVG